MKTILCFGDSNTWGYKPESGERFAPGVRWCGVLRDSLGAGYDVIEEGLNGRTTAFDDPQSAYRNGADYLPPCLATHSPIDLVIIMLGSNDLKNRLGLSAEEIASGMDKLLGIIENSGAGANGAAPRTLLVSPPHVSPEAIYEDFFGIHEKSTRLGPLYAALAAKYRCGFFDAATVIDISGLPDGLHLGAGAHKTLGERLAELIKGML
jgi:lysophospholipase L1-like esterase